MSIDLKGIITPVVTPFNPDESIDEAGFRRIIEYLIEHGVYGIFVAGGQGEGVSLERDEKLRLLDIALETVNGRVPVLMGTGAVTTRGAVAMTRAAKAAGADAATIITPYYLTPTGEELFAHYAAVLDAVDIPVLIYNNHWRTQVNIAPATVARLAAHSPNLIGMKDSSGDLSRTIKYKTVTPGGFKVFIGRDQLIHAGLCSGLDGAVAATSNAAIDIVVGIYNAFVAGDDARARELQARLTPLREFFAEGTFPVVVKEAMCLQGIECGGCRRPVGPLPEETRARLRAILAGMGLLNQ